MKSRISRKEFPRFHFSADCRPGLVPVKRTGIVNEEVWIASPIKVGPGCFLWYLRRNGSDGKIGVQTAVVEIT